MLAINWSILGPCPAPRSTFSAVCRFFGRRILIAASSRYPPGFATCATAFSVPTESASFSPEAIFVSSSPGAPLDLLPSPGMLGSCGSCAFSNRLLEKRRKQIENRKIRCATVNTSQRVWSIALEHLRHPQYPPAQPPIGGLSLHSSWRPRQLRSTSPACRGFPFPVTSTAQEASKLQAKFIFF